MKRPGRSVGHVAGSGQHLHEHGDPRLPWPWSMSRTRAARSCPRRRGTAGPGRRPRWRRCRRAAPPEIETHPLTREEKPGLPLVPGSSARMPTSAAVMRARRLAADADAGGVDPVLRALARSQRTRRLGVVLGVDAALVQAAAEVRAAARSRDQPVVDRHGDVAALGELGRHVRRDARGLVAAAEAAAVHEHDRRAARARVPRRLVDVELQRLVDAARVHRAAVLEVVRDGDRAEHRVAVAQRRAPRRPWHEAAAEDDRGAATMARTRRCLLRPIGGSCLIGTHGGGAGFRPG